MARTSEELAQLVSLHLLDISAGHCSISREQILEGQDDQSLAEVLTGLLMLHEDLVMQRSQVVRAEELETTLAKLAERNRAIEESRTELAALNEQLSTPIIKIWRGVLMLPIIGAVDQARASDMTERLLAAIQRERAVFVILDITGVSDIDTTTANYFVRIVAAAKLLGTQTLIAGLRAAVATTLVTLGIDLSSITALRTAEEALRRCMERLG